MIPGPGLPVILIKQVMHHQHFDLNPSCEVKLQ
jgi:hypothetical protein